MRRYATNSTRGAMRDFVLGRSRAEPTKTRRVAQDCDPKTYMYMSSISPEAVGRIAKRALAGCHKDALIGRFSWASTVAPTVTARWKANQHRASHSTPTFNAKPGAVAKSGTSITRSMV